MADRSQGDGGLVRRLRTGAEASERADLDPSSPWWGEHRSRYHFAAQEARGRVVLDCASGTGYGSEIIAAAGAALVVALDPVEVAGTSFEDRAVQGCRADGKALPLRDSSIDLIASFETVEHIEKDEVFVAELRRVLKPGGKLVLSTPNALQTRPVNGRPANPFHVREYTPSELQGLLERYFDAVELLGQQAREAYAINPYWQRREDLLSDPSTRRAFWLWRFENLLPFAVKERLSHLVHKRSFYPGERDWEFVADHVNAAHVIVAVCT
jgi:SAM-dependent methyltransferase